MLGHVSEENLEGKVSLRKKAKPSPMKTIQPSMWLLFIMMLMMVVVFMCVVMVTIVVVMMILVFTVVMAMVVRVLPYVASLIVETQNGAETFPMASES